MMVHTWQQMIIEEYPLLFVRSYRGLPFSPGYPDCADGWHDVVARLTARVSRSVRGYPVYFTRILAQHGRLQVQWASDSVVPKRLQLEIDEAVALADARSACTCARCGGVGRMYAHGTRLLTVCPRHAHGIPVPTFGGVEDLHVVKVVGKAIVCRRYDRDSDAFLQISRDATK